MQNRAVKNSEAEVGITARRIALRIVTRWLQTAEFPNRLLPAGVADYGFIMDLVYGVVRGRRRLEWLLQKFVQRRPEAPLEAALLLGAHQLLFMKSVADYAALHATIEAIKGETAGSVSFANAVLRNIQRKRKKLLEELERQPLAVRLSHPDILVQRWNERYGTEATEALCAWNNEPAQTCILLLPRKGAETLPLRWQELERPPQKHATRADTWILPHGVRIENLPGFAEGLLTLQDPSTLAAVELLDARPGLRVLDACAAPGGKTAQIATRMAEQGELIAMDLYADRLVHLRQNLKRLKLSHWVEVRQGDARVSQQRLFDRILLDAPCSNSGVLRRRPDARWRFSAERQQTLVATQRRLLEGLLPQLATGGRLVYSTCSMEPEENRELLERVLKSSPRYRVVAIRESRPDRDATDGAFAAAIEAQTS